MSEIKQFNGGALRGSDPPAYRRITHQFLSRVAEALQKGAEEKYPDHADGLDNWKHGDREFAQAAYDHAIEHLSKWKEAEGYPAKAEDHLAHAACNLMFLMWYEELGTWDPWAEENRRDIDDQLEAFPAEEVIDYDALDYNVTPKEEPVAEDVVPIEERVRRFFFPSRYVEKGGR